MSLYTLFRPVASLSIGLGKALEAMGRQMLTPAAAATYPAQAGLVLGEGETLKPINYKAVSGLSQAAIKSGERGEVVNVASGGLTLDGVLVAPTANVAGTVKLGKSSLIFYGVNVDESSSIGAESIILDNAKIGKSVSVGNGAVVATGVVIGENSKVGSGAFISAGAKVGKNVTIEDNAFIAVGAEVKDGAIVKGAQTTNLQSLAKFIQTQRELGLEHKLFCARSWTDVINQRLDDAEAEIENFDNKVSFGGDDIPSAYPIFNLKPPQKSIQEV